MSKLTTTKDKLRSYLLDAILNSSSKGISLTQETRVSGKPYRGVGFQCESCNAKTWRPYYRFKQLPNFLCQPCATSAKCKKLPYEHLYKRMMNVCQYVGKENDLTYEEFLKFTEIEKCHYCQVKIKWVKHVEGKVRGSYQLDRKDSNLPYTVDNCVVCCKRCNSAKSNHFTYEEFLKIGEVIRTFNVVDDTNSICSANGEVFNS